MRRIIFISSVFLFSIFSQKLHPQIVGFYPPADTIVIGFGCTPPVIICSISPDYIETDSIIVDPGWNTVMGIQDSLGNWDMIDRSYFLVKDELDRLEYEMRYIPRSYPFDSPIVVPFDTSFECYHHYFDLQLIIRKQNRANDSISFTFQARIGLDVKDEENTPLVSKQARLFQNYPNPFNPLTNIQFFLPKAGPVKIEAFDLTGKKVATILNSNRAAGAHSVEFDGSNLAGGIYFYRLQVGQFVDVKKMILMK